MPEVTIAPSELAQKLKSALEEGLREQGFDAVVTTEAVPTTLLCRATVVSSRFEGLWASEQDRVVEGIIEERLTSEERKRISIIYTSEPEEAPAP